MTQAAALVVSVLAVAVVSLLGRSVTATDTGSWYDRIDKPPFTPPGPVFGIAWGLLYLAMAVAAWLVWRHGRDRRQVRLALGLYVAQLVLNLGWTTVFFGLERPGWAFVEIVVLVAVTAVMVGRFFALDRVAGWLMVPYLAWLSFATLLTASICVLNA